METVGTLLWELRTAARWSLGELARQSGVSKGALSQWESGARTPRIPELEATLNALQADAAQRLRILAAIKAPRALRLLRQRTPDPHEASAPSVPPPTVGDLLRALRNRKGWTQERLASSLNVRRATVTRWEQGERIPSTERMQEICYVLDAREEEIVALTTGRLPEAHTSHPVSVAEMDSVFQLYLGGQDAGLEELTLWTMERQAWELSASDPAALPLLAQIYAYHAQFFRTRQRWSEIAPYVEKVQTLSRITPVPGKVLARNEILRATAAVHETESLRPRRGAYLLSAAVERASPYPEYQAWMISDMAEYLIMDGRNDAALERAAKAIAIAARAENPIETLLRRLDYSRLLLRAGRPAAAMDALPLIEEIMPASSLVRAEAEHQLGNLSEAANALQQAMERIERDDQANLRPLADALARRF